MDNFLRSKRTREAAIEAALTILARDGAKKLTIDAVARESGISKGGILHHFRTKDAVLRALIENQMEQVESYRADYLASLPADHPEPQLAAYIASFRKAFALPHSAVFAIAGTLGEAPDILETIRTKDAEQLATVRAQAANPVLAEVRWAATMGLAMSERFSLSPLSAEERERLFDYLQDDRNWSTAPAEAEAVPEAASPHPPRGRRAAAKRG
ncbi:TetR/AcrR family transcriptional regulator [Acidisoma sp. 7E03]